MTFLKGFDFWFFTPLGKMHNIFHQKVTREAPLVLGQGKGWGPLLPIKSFPLAYFMALSSLKQEAKTTYLGFLWWILNPLIYMVIYYILVVLIFKSRAEDYVLFLLVGLVIWRWSSVGIQQAANSIFNRSGLMRQAYFPKIVLPVSTIIHNTAMFLISLAVVLACLLLYGVDLTLMVLYLPVLMAIQFLLILALGIGMCIVVPFFPDIRNLMTFAFQAGVFLSGVLWDRSHIPEEYHIFFDINPMATLIEAYRAVLILGQEPNFNLLWPIVAISTVILIASLYGIAKIDRFFPKVTI